MHSAWPSRERHVVHPTEVTRGVEGAGGSEGRRERSMSSSESKASRPEFPSMPRIRFASAYFPDSVPVCDRDPVHFRGSRLPDLRSQALRQAFAIKVLSGAGL